MISGAEKANLGSTRSSVMLSKLHASERPGFPGDSRAGDKERVSPRAAPRERTGGELRARSREAEETKRHFGGRVVYPGRAKK